MIISFFMQVRGPNTFMPFEMCVSIVNLKLLLSPLMKPVVTKGKVLTC